LHSTAIQTSGLLLREKCLKNLELWMCPPSIKVVQHDANHWIHSTAWYRRILTHRRCCLGSCLTWAHRTCRYTFSCFCRCGFCHSVLHSLQRPVQHNLDCIMSGRYIYCLKCGNYLGSLGGNYCHLCDWKADSEDDDAETLEPEKPND